MLRLAETHDTLNVVCDQIGSPTYTAGTAYSLYLDIGENSFVDENDIVMILDKLLFCKSIPHERKRRWRTVAKNRKTPYYPFWHGSLQMLNDNMNDIGCA